MVIIIILNIILESTLHYTTNTAFICVGIVIIFKNPQNWPALVSIAAAGILIRIAGDLSAIRIAGNYLLTSTIPSIVIYIWCMYTSIKRLHYHLQSYVRLIFQLIFSIEFAGMMYYQYCEVTHTLKDSDFQHLILPRTIYILLAMQILFLSVSTCFPSLMCSVKGVPKSHRIYTFFGLLFLSVLPSMLMIVGEGQQIEFVFLYVIVFLVNFCMKEIGESNCFLHYVLYSLIVQKMYINTGHVLDFMALKIHRAFVGFPDFDTKYNYTIAFLDTTSVFTFFMMLVPILTIETYPDYCQKLMPNSNNGNSVEPIYSTPLGGETEKVEDEVQFRVIKNYLFILLHMELIHDALTRYLVANFHSWFFPISPVEFTFRIIDWFVFILAFGFTFAIGNI